MGKKFVIYGDTHFAEELYQIITLEGLDQVIAFTNNKDYMTRTSLQGLRVIPFDGLKASLNDSFELLLAFGYSKMNKIREKVYNECREIGMKVGKYVSTRAICYADSIGEGSLIWPNAYIGPGVVIGHCNIIHAGCICSHDNRVGDFNFFAPGSVLGGYACVENYCFVGMNSTIHNGVYLKDLTIIGSAANMLHSSEENRCYVGNPANIIEKQSIEIII